MKKFALEKDVWAIAFAGVLLGRHKQGQKVTRYRAMKEANQLLEGVALPPKAGACYPKMTEFERQRLVLLVATGTEELLTPQPALKRWFASAAATLAVSSAEKMLKDWQTCLKSIILCGDANLLADVLSGLTVVAYSLPLAAAKLSKKDGANGAILLALKNERKRFANYLEATIADYNEIAKKLA